MIALKLRPCETQQAVARVIQLLAHRGVLAVRSTLGHEVVDRSHRLTRATFSEHAKADNGAHLRRHDTATAALGVEDSASRLAHRISTSKLLGVVDAIAVLIRVHINMPGEGPLGDLQKQLREAVFALPKLFAQLLAVRCQRCKRRLVGRRIMN